MTTPLVEWLRENAPDCGDNSCLFGGRGKGGMRTNGGCRCFKDLPTAKRVYVERLYAVLSETEPNPEQRGSELEKANVGLADEAARMRIALSELVEAGEAFDNRDDMTAEEEQAAVERWDAALAAAKPFTEEALLKQSQYVGDEK